jgi:hypothetical protein
LASILVGFLQPGINLFTFQHLTLIDLANGSPPLHPAMFSAR